MVKFFTQLQKQVIRYAGLLHESADEDIRRETYRVNLRRLVVLGPVFFVIELSLLPLEQYLLGVGNVLLIFLIANAFVYPFVYVASKHQQRISERILRLATYAYLLTFIGLGSGLSLKGLMSTDLVHVYLMTVVAVSIFFIVPPFDHLIFLLCSMVPYLIIYPRVLLHKEIRYVILNNVIVFSIMSWLLGRMVYSVIIRMLKAQQKLEQQNRMLSDLARRDPMTGLLNHGALQELLWATIQATQGTDTSFSVILFDIDNFKSVNDTYGHLSGDTVIQRVSLTTLDSIGEKGGVGRYGGDEFLIILPDTSMQQACEIADELWAAIARTRFAEVTTPVTLSGGVVSCRCEADLSVEQIATLLIKCADTNLFAAKSRGKNQYLSEMVTSP